MLLDEYCSLEIDEDMAEIILQMGADCYSEGLLREEAMELLLTIREEFPDIADDYRWVFHRAEK